MNKKMKRPISNITQDSIKPSLSNAVEFYTNKNREAHKCIQERDEYIDYLESQLNNAKPQQALPVVPECVAKFIEDCKKEGECLFGVFADATRVEYDMPDFVYFWLGDKGNNDELFARSWLDGYQVEKQQLFYLKNKIGLEDVGIDLIGYLNLFLTNGGYLTNNINRAKKFTQQEIDSMQTGSYELVPVEDGE